LAAQPPQFLGSFTELVHLVVPFLAVMGELTDLKPGLEEFVVAQLYPVAKNKDFWTTSFFTGILVRPGMGIGMAPVAKVPPIRSRPPVV
ncbi:unnamed protein product, partial [marine sediment metagenome]